MVASPERRSLVITQSKIIHKARVIHQLARFVTEETAGMLVNLKPEQIYRLECWENVVYVHGKGVSQFLSYADFPPILGVEPPKVRDFVRWRKRRNCKSKRKQDPDFWKAFYTHQFKQADSAAKLLAWGKLVGLVKCAMSEAALQGLREVYQKEKYAWENF